MQKELAKCVDPLRGQIQVNEFCQVTQNHPLIELEDNMSSNSFGKTFHDIFAFGDVCLTPRNEEKSIVSMYQYYNQACNNIIQQLKSIHNADHYQPIPENFVSLQAIPLGTKMGLFAINDQLMMNASVIQQKMEIETDCLKQMRNDYNALVKEQGKLSTMSWVFSILNSYALSFFNCGSKNSNKARRQRELMDKIRLRLKEQKQ